jgi:N-acetylmuramic acid 6-phosphate etherase
MRPTNEKLRARARRIVAELARVAPEEAARALAAAGDDIKVAIVSAALGLDVEEAGRRLAAVGRRLAAFEELA